MEKLFDVPTGGGGIGRAQSEKVGQISFRPPNFFLPVRPWLSDHNFAPVACGKSPDIFIAPVLLQEET